MFKQQIESQREELIQQVLNSVKINSVRGEAEPDKPFGAGPCEALAHALALAESLGFRTKNLDNMIGFAEYGEGKEMIAVLGHLDIVPIGEDWDFNPFGEIANDRIYGRGTLDDKGPIIGALFALAAIRDSGVSLRRRIRIIFGTNEESGDEDVERYNKSEELPVMGFTPDADYPVIFSEKGMVRFTLEKKLQQSGCGARLLSAAAGTAVNLVPDQAVCELLMEDNSRRVLELAGISAHGSTPELGENAISKLMQAMGELSLTEDLASFVEFFNTSVGKETDGKGLGLACATEKFGDTTVNAGLLEGDENSIKITFDCRYPAGDHFEERFAGLKEKAAAAGLLADLSRNTPPLHVPEDSELVRTLQEVYHQQTGTNPPPMVIGGGTYAKTMENIVAFGPIFPDQENVIHQKNEYISIEHLMKNVQIMANAMYRLAK